MKMTRAPLRISFFGGGTDYPAYFKEHGGAVLGSAIDKYSYITASPFPSRLFDYAVRVSYRKVELVKTVEEIEHRVYRACLEHCGISRDVELHNVADLPTFTGLGSSSTFTVGLLQALHAFKGRDVSGIELAREGIHIEQEVLKENVGCQDQTFAAVGGLNRILFHPDGELEVHPLALPDDDLADLEKHLMLIFTGMTRRASDIVVNQLERIGDNTSTLHTMRQMVDEGFDLLTSGKDIAAFGKLLHEAWLAKRSLAGSVSNPTIDSMYETARTAGAYGGKLLGAGGGGFLLVVADPERHSALHEAFADYEIIKVRLNAPGAQVVFDPS